jgi:hypothetical protein
MRLLSFALAIWAALLCGAAQCNDQPAAPQVTMPDGTPFAEWDDQTHYTRTYHVCQNYPFGSDENPGTEAQPFRTINRAANVVRPGERVVIHVGVYREMIRPRFGGEGPNRMIAYEAAPGEQVVVKGSQILQTAWARSIDPHSQNHRSIYSKKLWMTVLPDSLFENGYFPFRTPNASNEDLDLMEWAVQWKGRIPYCLPRGLLFQDGQRMVQLATYEDLVRLPGSYWVAPDGKTVHIHAFGSGDPNGKTFEAAVQPHILQPLSSGLGFIRVSGLILEQCANGIPRVGVGALYTMGGHHWIIEGNTVRHVNSVGIEMGYRTFEYGDRRFAPRTDPDIGYNIVRRNRIYDCGTAGIRGLNVSHALVEENDITDCGWQDAEFHWEVAGIKLLVNRGTLVHNNHIARIQAGGGIWLDWDNKNSRVTGNIIHDISTAQAAIFVEASQHPNLVDRNVIWNIDGQGVRAADTDNLIVMHNLLGRITEEPVYAEVATDRSLNGRKLTSTGNQVTHNIFIDMQKPIAFGDPSNVADYNVYVSTPNAARAAVQDHGPHTRAIEGEVEFTACELLLKSHTAQSLSYVTLLKGADQDLFGGQCSSEFNRPGPYLDLSRPETLQITIPRNE